MSLHIKRQLGFSLIELMVVLSIIGILASIAIPSFNRYIERGRRAEGKAFALDIASRQERHFTQFNRYAGGFAAIGAAATMGNLALPNGNTSENGNYMAAITTIAANGNTTYIITLTPVPATRDPECGALTLTNTGVRDIGSGATSTIVECWR